jgi:Kef-type K+ transport system membrane component KefB
MDSAIADVIGDISLVLIVSAVFGAIARKLGQPSVVGQILAGILLGPSLLGRFPGHLTTKIFPHIALPYLNVLSQVAVVIFMFTVGYELDWRRHAKGRTPLFVAAGALLVPMGLGAGTTLALRTGFAAVGQAHTSRSFVLFMGVAMSITALPVLAAIVRECGITATIPARTAISAAGLMDAAAWFVLAIALAGPSGRPHRPWLVTFALFMLFVMVMLLVVRPALRWWTESRLVLADQLTIAAVVLALGSAWITTSLGQHPIFGAFLAGLVFPRSNGVPDADVLRRTEEIGGLLLPLFFVVTGLSTNVGAFGASAVMLLGILCFVAGAGKIGSAYVASRVGGLDPRDSATVAVLLNARGLTELIALSAGLSAGIIGKQLYSILVIMALTMTVLTAPLLLVIPGRRLSLPRAQVISRSDS